MNDKTNPLLSGLTANKTGQKTYDPPKATEKKEQPAKSVGRPTPESGDKPKDKKRAPSKSVGRPTVQPIKTDLITPWAYADRPDSEMGDLDELAESILQGGQSVPALVRPKGKGYELIYGRCRYTACKMVGIDLICIIEDLTDEEAYSRQANENHHRKNLSPWAKAVSYKKALDEGLYKSATSLSVAVGESRSTVANLLSVFGRIDSDISDAIGNMTLVGERTAKVINSLCEADKGNKKAIIEVADKIRDGTLKGKALENQIMAGRGGSEVGNGAVTYGDGMFSVSTSSKGALTITILKKGKGVMDQEEIAKNLLEIFEKKSPKK